MEKVAIYSESASTGLGGAEHCVAVVAEALCHQFEVEIVHHKPESAARQMGEHFGCDLSGVTFRFVPRSSDVSPHCWTPWTRARKARAWLRELSGGCDYFVAFLHNKPPFCQTRRGILISLFPTFKPGIKFPAITTKKTKKKPLVTKQLMLPAAGAGLLAWEWLHRAYNRREWADRLATYPLKLSISEFTRAWTRKRWGCDTAILHPPVETAFADQPKQNVILSVGRFASSGHSKRQPFMLDAFRTLTSELPDWRYHCIGGLTSETGDQALYQKCLKLAENIPAVVEANADRRRLRQTFETAAIFWHAAGYGDDEKKHPEDAEHFGISTVEAMAAGCVPVVINKGGQPEIVEHGVSGFVWDNPEEMLHHTRLLAADPMLRSRMSQAARKRAALFSRESFIKKLLAYLSEMS